MRQCCTRWIERSALDEENAKAFEAKNQTSPDGARDPPQDAGTNTSTLGEKGESVIVMKTLCALLVTSILSLSAAIAATEQEIVNESAAILRDFRRMPE